jgi:Tol biopolymer transport system component
MKKVFLISVVAWMLLTACGQRNTPAAFPSLTPESIATIATDQPSFQSTSLQTLQILGDIPADLKVHGTILIEGYTGNLSYFLDIENKSKTAMPNGFFRAKVSPDGRRLAYFENAEENKVDLVITSNFVNKVIIPWEKEWYLDGMGISGELFIEKKRENLLPSYMILDPSTKEVREFLPDYPDIETEYYSPEWWRPVYSPNGKEVVYPRVSISSRIVLWDQEKEQVITSLTSTNNPYGLKPAWSSDGRYFVIALENKYIETLEYPSHELFLVGQNGDTKQLTYLMKFYNDTIRIGSYSWSPDNSRVAFQLMHQDKGQLAVVDSATNEVKVYDLPGYFVHHEPIWSPDGKFILIDGYFEGSKDYWTVLVDLNKNHAIKIAINSFPVGWVSFTP